MSLPYSKTPTEDLLVGMGEFDWPFTPPMGFMRAEVCAVIAGDKVRAWSKGKWARRWKVHHSTVTRRLDEAREFLDEHGGAEWWEPVSDNRRSRRDIFLSFYSRRDIFLSFYSLEAPEKAGSERGVGAGVARGERGVSADPTPDVVGIVDDEARGGRGVGAGVARGERGHRARVSSETETGDRDSLVGLAQPDLFDEDPHPDRPDPTLELFESLVALGVEHGHLRASRPPDPSVKVGKTRTRLQELKALERDEGRELVLKAWAWVLTSADAAWWREKRKGALLLDTFMVRENFRRLAESALEAEQAQGAGGEVIPLHAPFQRALQVMDGRGRRRPPRSPQEMAQLFGDRWELHEAALRVLGDGLGPDEGLVQGWVRIATAKVGFEQSQLGKLYDRAFTQAAQRGSA